MSLLQEDDIEITIPNAVCVRKFDDAEQHGLLHCMKAVDFIVELPDKYLYIEIKDPDNPNARQRNRKNFIDELTSNKLDEKLKYKFRDSFIYEWASESRMKPIYYLVLIALKALTEAELLTRTDSLNQILPCFGPKSGAWKRKIVAGCSVFNIDTWKRILPDYKLHRLSENE